MRRGYGKEEESAQKRSSVEQTTLFTMDDIDVRHHLGPIWTPIISPPFHWQEVSPGAPEVPASRASVQPLISQLCDR